jgi:hypothetical protein
LMRWRQWSTNRADGRQNVQLVHLYELFGSLEEPALPKG